MSCLVFIGPFAAMIQNAITDPIGIALNGMSVVCFVQILWNNKDDSAVVNSQTRMNMFKYLLIKSVCDFSIFGIDIVYVQGYFCNKACHLQANPVLPIWNAYFIYSLQFLLFMLSSMMEAAATLGKPLN
jgi:hypothetical protein